MYLYVQFVKNNLDQRPEEIAANICKVFPEITLNEASDAFRHFIRPSGGAEYAALIEADTSTISTEHDTAVEAASYQAWLLRLAFPQTEAADIAQAIHVSYTSLTSVQMTLVLKHGEPYPVFPDLTPEATASVLIRPEVGYGQPPAVAQALHLSGVFPECLHALDTAKVLKSAHVFPQLDKEAMKNALQSAQFNDTEIAEALAALYPDPIVLQPPSGLSLQYDAIQQRVEATWQASVLPPALQGKTALYSIRLYSAGYTDQTAAQMDGLTNPAVQLTLDNGQPFAEGDQYSAQVKVTVEGYSSDWSTHSSPVTIIGLQPPQQVAIAVQSDSTLLLSWSPLAGTTDFQIRVTNEAGQPIDLQPKYAISGNEGKVDMTLLPRPARYNAQVRGMFQVQAGPWSEPVPFTNGKSGLEATFSINPPQLQGFGMVHSDGAFENDHIKLGISQNVTLSFNWDAAAHSSDTAALSLSALVSRTSEGEGYSPITISVNGNTVIADYTIPGGGYGAYPNFFIIPPVYLFQGANQLQIQTSPAARTYLWLYNLNLKIFRYVQENDVADFSKNPPAVNQNLRLIENSGEIAGDHIRIGNNDKVAVEFGSGEFQNQFGHTLFSVYGLVSRSSESEGYSPITLKVNGQPIISNFTVPGAGFAPHLIQFVIPSSQLANGTNTARLQVAPDARTFFWLYNLQITRLTYYQETASCNLSTNPPATHNVSVQRNDGRFAGDHFVYYRNGTFQASMEFQQGYAFPIVVNYNGLVSRNGNQAGKAPVEISFNDQPLAANYTFPGAGFGYVDSYFTAAIPILRPGANTTSLIVNADSVTLFWLRGLKIYQLQGGGGL